VTAGAGLGLLAATGCWNLMRSVRRRRLRLAERIAPYVSEHYAPPAAGPVWSQAVRSGARRLGGSISVRRRLAALGDEGAVEQFRIEQLTWAGAGLLLALLLCGFAAARGARVSPGVVLLLAVVCTAGGALARDRRLSAQVSRREERMLAELPAVAEMLALSVGAGEGVTGALERVSRIARGELAGELRRTLADARAGTPVVDALTQMAARSSLPALSRFVDGVAVAVERGTPLADVLRAQAGDVREERRRALLAIGGRKEIAMLFPVVFLVLPVTVVFALYPGFANLSLAVP
jgi:tight adherence protein C